MATINVIVGCFEGRSRVHGRRQQDAVEVVSDVLVTEVANAQVVTERATLHDASVHKNTIQLVLVVENIVVEFRPGSHVFMSRLCPYRLSGGVLKEAGAVDCTFCCG